MIGQPTPTTNNVPKIVVVLRITTKILNNKIKYNKMINEPPIKPYSSTTIAKIKSDSEAYKKFF